MAKIHSAPKIQKKSFSTPEEIRSLPKTKIEVVTLGDVTAMKTIFEPGWSWEEHIQPKAGTSTCQVLHVGYVISGRLKVKMDDGSEETFGPNDTFLIPPGHTAWVEGDETYVALDFQGGKIYGK